MSMRLEWHFRKETMLPIIAVEGASKDKRDIKPMLEFVIKTIESANKYKGTVMAPNLNSNDKNFTIKVSFALIFPDADHLIQFVEIIDKLYKTVQLNCFLYIIKKLKKQE